MFNFSLLQLSGRAYSNVVLTALVAMNLKIDDSMAVNFRRA